MIQPISLVMNCDCMEYMKALPDKSINLAVCDPPYGIGFAGFEKHYGWGKAVAPTKLHKPFAGGDKESPDSEYFEELVRVSCNQIIFGANHFISKIPIDTSCWIVWDKLNGKNLFADCELAWTSFDTVVRIFRFRWQGMLQGDMKNKEERIHPTQKPVALYSWIFKNYARAGDKILDTHGGSMSSVIAALKAGLEIHCCEMDADYYNAAKKRVLNYLDQETLFQERPNIIFKP